jgi:hypothetical protein
MAAKVTIHGDTVKVRLPLLAPILAFRTSFSIPLAHVTDAYAKHPSQMDVGRRVLGFTSIPGVMMVGTRRSAGKFTFWYAMANREALVLELRDERYGQIAVNVNDPAGVAARVKEAAQGRTA